MNGIPFMVTQAMKAALRARGLTEEEIAQLKPEEAHKILNGGGAPPEPNRAWAEEFLKALDPSTDRFTFQTFDDNKERKKERAEANKLRKQQGKKPLKDPFAHIFHGTLAEHWNELVTLNAQGAGVYVTVNETDFKGRTEKNIVRVRAQFVDLDGAPFAPINDLKQTPTQPHIIVESSPKRFHAYWLIKPLVVEHDKKEADGKITKAKEVDGKITPDQFSAVQKAIAARYSGDSAVHDLPRVMRLPGFIHRKGAPFLSAPGTRKGERYDWNEVRKAFDAQTEEEAQPQPQPKPPRPSTPNDLSNQWKKLNDEAIRRYGDWVPDIFPAAQKTANGYRVTSADLGRVLEEDLSFHSGGIKDFGVHDMGDPRGGSRTPIDIVEQYLHKDFNDAVRWLAQKLGLDPNDYLPKPGTGDPAMDAEIERLAKLSDVDYDRKRLAFAKKFQVRPVTLDKLVSNARIKLALKKIAPAAKNMLAQMNAKNCVVLDGARTRVLRFEEVEHDAGGEHYVYHVPTFLRFEDFRNLYLNRHVMVGKRPVDLGSWWLEHPQRQQYPGIVFKPGGQHIINSKLNLWRGWGVTPRRGDWGLMREHIFEVCAARDDEVDTYVINWLAWAVQHPDEQAEAALVFLGDRGTGRGTLGKVMCKLFGQHAHHVSSPIHMTGRFNAHMRQCSFLFADEAYAPGDKSAEGQLKRIITEPTLPIEKKGFDVIEEPNRLHAMFASNEDWVVPAGAFERRYVVQEVANTYRQDKTWFGPIYEQLRSGGYEAILFDLLERDLGNWHPRDIVRTAALAAQQEQSLSPFDAWWFEMLQAGVVTGADVAHPDRAVSNRYKEEIEESIGYGAKRTHTVWHNGLYDQAKRISPKLKNETDTALGRYLDKRGCTDIWITHGRSRRGWQLPPLDKCRADWLVRFPQTQWRDPGMKEWTADED